VDPARGASPWKRIVTAGEQVLVCPDCQHRQGWDADADRCSACGSTALVKALGDVRCRACGIVQEAPDARSEPVAPPPDLSAEVAAALDRLFGREPGPGA
jgi:DNA-directed RNA polymerase subunit RPC12/RpoP